MALSSFHHCPACNLTPLYHAIRRHPEWSKGGGNYVYIAKHVDKDEEDVGAEE